MSGGPDSLALLLLAQAARPGLVEAATVDHGLRAESADEAQMVARLCRDLGIAHAILPVKVGRGNLQAEARAARYRALDEWMEARRLELLATAHHADDQAETLLMRLNRGSGLSGLAGARASGNVPDSRRRLVRPLLAWRKHELCELVRVAGAIPVSDPSNADEDFDRVRIRNALAQADWLDPVAIAQSAAHLADAAEALDWCIEREWQRGVSECGGGLLYRPDAPRAVRLGVLVRAIGVLGQQPRGGAAARLLDQLERGDGGNLGLVLVTCEEGGWMLRREPPRH
ncbi:MAG: tRNA lysidine(34) synthetase TilS [Erythrobacter sp.]|nr:tRNA lysidine(34) synthetase TilS [Erythrobacter sp.]